MIDAQRLNALRHEMWRDLKSSLTYNGHSHYEMDVYSIFEGSNPERWMLRKLGVLEPYSEKQLNQMTQVLVDLPRWVRANTSSRPSETIVSMYNQADW